MDEKKLDKKKKLDFKVNLELEIEELEMQIDPISLCSGGTGGGDPFLARGDQDPWADDDDLPLSALEGRSEE